MSMKPSSETFLSRLFLIMMLIICLLLPLLTITTRASAEEPATSTDIVTDPTPAFDFKFQCTGSYSSQVEELLKITIIDQYNSGWRKVEVRIDNDAWENVTGKVSSESTYKFYVWKNCTVTVRVTDKLGNQHTGKKVIDIFDFTSPTVTAGIRNTLLHVEAADSQSGVAGVKVNDMLFTTLIDGQLDVQLQELLNSYQKLTIYAIDNAGNKSNSVVLTNPYYVTPTCPATATPEPSATPKPTKKPSSGSSSTKKPKATATPAVTAAPEVTVVPPMVTPYVIGPGQPYVSEANMGVQSMLYSAHTNKQFIEVASRNGEVYYLVIDYDKPIDAEGDLYETYFLNMVDDRDLLAVLEEDEIPTPTPTIAPTTAPTPIPVVQPEPEPEPDNSAALMGMMVLLLAAGGGAAFWFIKQKGGKSSRQPIENEYDDLEDEDDSDDDEIITD